MIALTPSRVSSLGIAAIYVLYLYGTGGGEAAFMCAIRVVWPVAFIWFADYFEHYRGWAGPFIIWRGSPAVFLRVVGWIVLLVYLTISVMR